MTGTEQMAAEQTLVNRGHDAALDANRFGFGENWRRFLRLLDDERIGEAERSMQDLLEISSLDGRRFLDIGSGSGLFSLAARRLGARVHSFDYDVDSVGCTAELKRRFYAGDANWIVEQGSILSPDYVRSLGTFDIVYSWGVLHHTGDMWRALENAAALTVPGGLLAVALYNDAGGRSRRWRALKRIYNTLPKPLRPAFAVLTSAPGELRAAAGALVRLDPGEYVRTWTQYGKGRRGMNRWRDIVDWVGGYPYEYARTDQVFDFYRARGFSLRRLRCSSGALGCNEFVFSREHARPGEGRR
jgi:2-polyprenyl-6-hydroxyphenyl methylase/3-demethylubiquinone-9 3-methyltransferase